MSVQVDSSYYLKKKYGSLERFISYFHQIESIADLPGESVLFIGVGDGLVPDYIRRTTNKKITTVDIDPELAPDILADVRSLPCAEKSFDIVVAYEVLEHIPYEDFKDVLPRLARIARNTVVLSVPFRHTGFEAVFKFPSIRTLTKKNFLRLSLTWPITFPGFKESGQHYWEMDGVQFPPSRVMSDIKKYFKIEKKFSPVLDTFRQFFILIPQDQLLDHEYVQGYYNQYLQSLPDEYIKARWFQSVESRFDYEQTRRALRRVIVDTQYDSVLELGPGDGVWTRDIQEVAKQLTLLDQSVEMINRAKERLHDFKNITYLIGDMTTTSLSGVYDAVYAMRCFEYIVDKKALLAKISTHLANSGSIFIVTKNPLYFSAQGKTHKKLHRLQISHVEMEEIARDAGLRLVATYPATLRWKSKYAISRLFFTLLQRVMVYQKSTLGLDWLTTYATESYMYILKK